MDPAGAQGPPPSAVPIDETVMLGSPTPHGGPIALTNAQKSIIKDHVRQENSRPASPVNFETSVGSPVPPSLELYILPDPVLNAVPEAKVVKYTVVRDKIVLVDPTNMRVVDVIDNRN
jgi:hypothetical protein